ncbi:MAG TPA: NfeD family protein [Ferruginibacter sp.]|nr:NfeD family protein [Ferruginibacter sp.]
MEFFNALEPLLKLFWLVAIPASVIFLIQAIMTFTGSDAMEGTSADFDSNLEGTDTPFQLFSLRNLVNFLLGFGWTGISFYDVISSKPLLIGLSIVVGLLFVFVFFAIIRKMMQLSENNSFNIQHTVGKVADVYLRIPAHKSGKGKVSVSVKGAFHEVDAVTEQDAIPSGTPVKIIQVMSGNILLVETL